MPKRKLPNSTPGRLKALQAIIDRKNHIPAPAIIPFSAANMAQLDAFFPVYHAKAMAVGQALSKQAAITAKVKEDRERAELFISHFFQTLQNAIRRGLFAESVRGLYGLALTDKRVPVLNSEADILFWGDKAATGEAARLAAGGLPLAFPDIAEVSAAVGSFENSNLQQADAKDAFDNAQEALAVETPACNLLIRRLWNEAETTFDTGDRPSMRRKTREWGLVYILAKGEKEEG